MGNLHLISCKRGTTKRQKNCRSKPKTCFYVLHLEMWKVSFSSTHLKQYDLMTAIPHELHSTNRNKYIGTLVKCDFVHYIHLSVAAASPEV